MDSWQELLIKTQIEGLITEREAMIAANAERYANNKTQAYNEEAFQTLVKCFSGIEEYIRNL